MIDAMNTNDTTNTLDIANGAGPHDGNVTRYCNINTNGIPTTLPPT